MAFTVSVGGFRRSAGNQVRPARCQSVLKARVRVVASCPSTSRGRASQDAAGIQQLHYDASLPVAPHSQRVHGLKAAGKTPAAPNALSLFFRATEGRKHRIRRCLRCSSNFCMVYRSFFKCNLVAKVAEFLVVFIPLVGAFKDVDAGGFVHAETIRGRSVAEPVAPEDKN